MPHPTAFETLQRLAKPRARGEHCELCGVSIAAAHEHLVEPARRRLMCVCQACAILFSAAGQRYNRVPTHACLLEGFRIADAEWDSLLVPINLAFFYRLSGSADVVAVYPSPA